MSQTQRSIKHCSSFTATIVHAGVEEGDCIDIGGFFISCVHYNSCETSAVLDAALCL